MISARPCRLPANRGEIEGIERRPSTLGPGGLAGSGWCRRGGERRLQKRARRSCWHLRIAISGPFLCRARRPLGIGQVSVWSWAEGVLYVVSRALPLQQPLARSPPPLARAFFVVRQGAGRTHNRQALPRCHEFRPRQHLSTGVWGAAAYARRCRRLLRGNRETHRLLDEHEGHPGEIGTKTPVWGKQTGDARQRDYPPRGRERTVGGDGLRTVRLMNAASRETVALWPRFFIGGGQARASRHT